jgi:hypothetical protein
MIASQQQSVDFMMSHRLGDRYIRLDEDTSAEQQMTLALDVATEAAMGTLSALASATMQRFRNTPRFLQLMSHSGATISTEGRHGARS